MDDRFDKENIEAETRYPRREAVDGHTRYPVREERRPLRFSSEHHTELPGRKIDAENDMTAYRRTATQKGRICRIPVRNSCRKRGHLSENLSSERTAERTDRGPPQQRARSARGAEGAQNERSGKSDAQQEKAP